MLLPMAGFPSFSQLSSIPLYIQLTFEQHGFELLLHVAVVTIVGVRDLWLVGSTDQTEGTHAERGPSVSYTWIFDREDGQHS